MRFLRRTTPAVAIALAIPGTSLAAGFGISEQSNSALGTAFAGTSVLSEDASSQWYNPATLSGLESDQLSVAVHQVMIDTSFEDGNAATTGDFEDVNATVPAFYYAQKLNDRTTFGLAINAPFGTRLEYENDWGGTLVAPGTYSGELYAKESDLQTLNVNPSIAWQATSDLSLGFGLNYQQIEADLDNDATRLEGDDSGYGWNAGLTWTPVDGQKLGLSWRSKINYDVEGDITFKDAGQTYDAETHVDMPGKLAFDYAGDISERTTLLAGISMREWSELDKLSVTHDGPSPPFPNPVVENLEWGNSVRSSLGVRHELVSGTVLRAGYAHETSTQDDDQERSALTPDADRDWLTLGARFMPTERMNIDVGYAHVMVDDADIDRNDAGRGPLEGSYELSANILGAQMNYRF
jgi:long-chain fatty acid transport protein